MNDKNPKCLYCLDIKQEWVWKEVKTKNGSFLKCVGSKPCAHCSGYMPSLP